MTKGAPVRALIVAAGWTVGWLLLWRPPLLGRRPQEAPAGGDVAVVVPARDEADRLPLLLASLARQRAAVAEVVVVDDHSSDGTAEVAREAGVRVVPAPPLPAGWTGKTWACHTGVDATTAGEVVLVDADVVLEPDALGEVLALRRRHGGLVSVQPRHDVARPVEALSLVCNVVAVMGLGIATPRRRHAGWGAAGPVLATSRDELARAGGHAAVAGDVAEDLGLAAAFRAAGLPVRCVLGGGQVRYRMYRDLPGLVRGWRKNMATGARRTPLPLRLGTALWVTALLAAALAVVELLSRAPGAAALLYGAVAAQVAVLGRRVGRFGPAAAVWPVLVVAFVGIVASSAVATFVRRRVTWSDRRIDLPRRGGPAAARPDRGWTAG